MNNKIIVDCTHVSKVYHQCMEKIHNFMNDFTLMNREQELLNRREIIMECGLSPEACNDPENLSPVAKLDSQLKRIENFKRLFTAGIVDKMWNDTNVSTHPEYITLFGQKMILNGGKSYKELHPVAQKQIESMVETVELFLRVVYSNAEDANEENVKNVKVHDHTDYIIIEKSSLVDPFDVFKFILSMM